MRLSTPPLLGLLSPVLVIFAVVEPCAFLVQAAGFSGAPVFVVAALWFLTVATLILSRTFLVLHK
jgi:hypothetical protein